MLTAIQPGKKALDAYPKEERRKIKKIQSLLQQLDVQLHTFKRLERALCLTTAPADQVRMHAEKNSAGYRYLEAWDQIIIYGQVSYDEITELHCLHSFLALTPVNSVASTRRVAHSDQAQYGAGTQ
jgi:hypothetical protein